MRKIVFLILLQLVFLFNASCQRANTGKIIFEENGGTEVTDLVYNDGEKIEFPVSYKENYEFLGWYLEEELLTKVKTISICSKIKLYAKWGKPTEGLYYKLNDDGASYSVVNPAILEYSQASIKGNPKEIIIPSYYNGLPVTNICKFAFYRMEQVKKVFLPKELKSIEKLAFGSCKLLTEIDIPQSVVFIGERAFEGCESLERMILPNGIVSVEEYAFSHCYRLKVLTIPESVVHMGHDILFSSDETKVFCEKKGNPSYWDMLWSGSRIVKWNCKYVSVTFMDGDNFVNEIVFCSNNKLDYYEIEKDGYEFNGWYKDFELTTPWIFDHDQVLENTILYAKFIKNGN